MTGALAARVGAQSPPGGYEFRIDTGERDSDPSINDDRQVVFWQGWAGTGEVFLYDADDGLVQLTNDQVHDISPVINAFGRIAWPRGEWNANYDVVMLVEDQIEVITDTPEPETEIDLNDFEQLVWRTDTCFPSFDCPEMFSLDGVDEAPRQLSFGWPIRFNQVPQRNNRGQVVWIEYNRTFGTWNIARRVMLYDNGRVTALSPENGRLGSVRINNAGQVMWSASGTHIWENGETREIIDFWGSPDFNDRGDVVFGATDKLWLLRNGVHYQVLWGPDLNHVRINNGGDIVGYGGGGSPEDIFAMFIDPIPGDHDRDGDVDSGDLVGFVGCMEGPGEGPRPPDQDCEPMDFDDDGDVDLRDFAADQLAYTGDCAVGITTPPIWKDACVGDPVELRVDVRGPAASYQWRKSQSDIQGATGPDFRIESARLSDSGFYGVRIMTECGWEVLSDDRFQIKVRSFKPSYLEHPQSQSVCPGEDVRFCTIFADRDFVEFQWEKGGEPIDPDEEDWWCHIIRDVQSDDAGEYRLAATNACGTTYSNVAVLTVETPIGPPLITVHPHDEITMRQGGTAPFYIRATCAEQYQWQKDDRDIPGATDRELNIYPVTCADAGQYTVVVSNELGSVTTLPGSLTVPDCP
jgi:hypothetical protein